MKLPITCAALLISCSSAFAQHSFFRHDSTAGFYVRASTPVYKIKSRNFSSSANPPFVEMVANPTPDYSYYPAGDLLREFPSRSHYADYKKFQMVNLSGGYRINRFFAAEIGLSYYTLKGPFLISSSETLSPPDSINYTALATSHSDLRSFKEVAVTPAIVLQPGFRHINPYIRAGVELPVYTQLFANTGSYNRIPGDKDFPGSLDAKGVQEIKLGFRPGFSGAAGVNWQVLPHLSVFAEYALRSAKTYFKTGEITSYSTFSGAAGVTRSINDLSPAEHYTHFVKHLDNNSNVYTGTRNGVAQYVDNSRPHDQERQGFKTSNMRLNAGIQYNF